MSTKRQDRPPNRDFKTNVRFTEREYIRISKEAKELGKTIPALLREVYFSGSELKFLMQPGIAKSILTELRRIGNNHNQIARRLNSGHGIDGFNNPVEETSKGLRRIYSYISGNGEAC
jgi:hypothetical protein